MHNENNSRPTKLYPPPSYLSPPLSFPHLNPPTPPLPHQPRPPRHEKLTNFGSLGLPSAPIPFRANRLSVYILRASSNPTRALFMIFCTSARPASSRPARESPA